MKIAVLGGGNGSFAAAGDMSLAGHEVTMWRRDREAVQAHNSSGGTVTVIDAKGRKTARLANITTDIGEAIADAQLAICPTPAFAHDEIASRAAPYWRDDQVVFLPPGTFGSYIFAKAAVDRGNRSQVSFAETGTLPWLARKQGPYEIRISGRGVRLPTGIFPRQSAVHAFDIIRQAFPNAIEDCGDILSAALMNAGPIIHPPLITMNAGPIEHFERWDIHKEGTQPSIRRVTDQLDAERIAVREALGYGSPHFPLADHYDRAGEPWMYSRDLHENVTESKDWSEKLDLMHHRYMLEDTKLGLSFLSSVGRLAKVPTPLANAFMSIGSAIAVEDFSQNGRTLKSLGLGSATKETLQRRLEEGFQ